MQIDKSYFTLPEILERWQITEADLIYLAENDKLRLSVRVFGAPMEFGDIEEDDRGQPYRVPWEQSYYSGLLDLHARDVFQLFRCGEVHLESFRTPRADYAETWGDAKPVLVMIGDLLLRRDERDRFEVEQIENGALVVEDGVVVVTGSESGPIPGTLAADGDALGIEQRLLDDVQRSRQPLGHDEVRVRAPVQRAGPIDVPVLHGGRPGHGRSALRRRRRTVTCRAGGLTRPDQATAHPKRVVACRPGPGLPSTSHEV